jgi:hypothetical protein
MRDGFAVFDSTCVRVHLDGRNAFQVMPYLFDVFPRMVAAFTGLQTKLRDQITRRTPAADKYAIQNSTSEVATALSALTSKTDLRGGSGKLDSSLSERLPLDGARMGA